GLPSLGLRRGARIADWPFWHQLYGWLAKAEFTLGLALACTDAMGLREHEPTPQYLLDPVGDVPTGGRGATAAQPAPAASPAGYRMPGRGHVAAGSIAMLKARQRMAEILRVLPGSSLVVAPAHKDPRAPPGSSLAVAPSDKDLAAPEVAAGLDESFAGGGYTALQRAALLQLASDH